MIRRAKASWHGVKLNQPDWSENSRSFAFCAELPKQNLMMHLIVSAHWESLKFELPLLVNGHRWRRWIDTYLQTPEDICDWDDAKPIPGTTYSAGPRSVVLLLADLV
jgi:glycogen operon protein